MIAGQQRLTTPQILLCAFRDVARSHQWEALSRSLNRLVENSDQDVMEHPEEERFKLWPTLLNRSVFQGVLLAETREKVASQYPLIKLPRKRKPEPRSNLVEAYLYFDASIRAYLTEAAIKTELSQEDLAFKLFRSPKQDFCVVEIVLSEGDDSGAQRGTGEGNRSLRIDGFCLFLETKQGQAKVTRAYCCIIGVCFSVGPFLAAAALISEGTVVISSSL